MSDTVTDIILKQLDILNQKLDDLTRHGCSRAPDHAEQAADHRAIDARVRKLEDAANEGKGRLMIAMMVLGSAVTAFFQWLGRHAN